MVDTPGATSASQPHMVTLGNTGEVFRCAEDVHVLAAMEQACCHGIPVGCCNGGCGAGKVRVTGGRYETRKMNRAVLSAIEEADGCVLACKTYPRSDMAVHAGGKPLPGNHSPFFAPVVEPSMKTSVKAMSLAVLTALQR